MDNNPSYYLNVHHLLDVNGQAIEQPAVSYPVKITGRYANIDYQAIPKLDNINQPRLSDSCSDVKYSYLLPINNSQSTPTQNGTMSLDQTLSEDEQIYEDPGHIKEEIYQWFKQRSIRMLDKSSVRYVHISTR